MKVALDGGGGSTPLASTSSTDAPPATVSTDSGAAPVKDAKGAKGAVDSFSKDGSAPTGGADLGTAAKATAVGTPAAGATAVSTSSNPAALAAANPTSTFHHRGAKAAEDTKRAGQAEQAKTELDSMDKLRHSQLYHVIAADSDDRKAFEAEAARKLSSYKQAVALNVMTSTMSTLGADSSVVQALDGGAKIKVVADDKVESDAAYDPKAGAILVKQSTVDTLYAQAGKLEDAHIADATGTVTNAVAADKSAVVDQVVKTGSLIGAHEHTHEVQDTTGVISSSNGKLDATYATLVADAAKISDPKARAAFLSKGSISMEHDRIVDEEYPAYHAQEQTQVGAGALTKTHLTIGADEQDLPQAQAVQNIYELQGTKGTYKDIGGITVTPAFARAARSKGDLTVDGFDVAGLKIPVHVTALEGEDGAKADAEDLSSSITSTASAAPRPITAAAAASAGSGSGDVLDTMLRAGSFITGARIPGGTIDGARIPGARIPGDTVDGARIPGEIFGARIPGLALAGARIPGDVVDGARIPGARIPGDTIDGARIPGARIPGDTIDGARIPGARIPGDTIDGARIPGARIPGDTIDGARIPGARIPGDTIDGARIPGARIPGDTIDGARIPGDTIDGARIPGSAIDGARIPGGVIDGARIPGDEIDGARIPGSLLD